MSNFNWDEPNRTNANSIVKNSIPHLNTPDKEKINCLSGSLIDAFTENVWVAGSGDNDVIQLFFNVFTAMYYRGQINEMYDLLRLQYGMLGLNFPDEVLQLEDKPEEKRYFLFSFFLDFDDVMADYIAEQS